MLAWTSDGHCTLTLNPEDLSALQLFEPDVDVKGRLSSPIGESFIYNLPDLYLIKLVKPLVS